MPDEILRLRTTVVPDEALAGINRVQSRLNQFQQQAGRGFQQANVQATALTRTISSMHREMSVLGRVVGTTIGGLTAGAVFRGFNEIAKRVTELRYASQELGMSERDIRAWSLAAERVGISSSSMTQGLQKFRDITQGLRFNVGGVRDELIRMGAGPIVRQMQNATNQAEKLKVAFQFKEALMRDDPTGFKARMFFEQIGLGADAARLSYEKYINAQQQLKPLTKEQQEAAEKFREGLLNISAAWDQLATKVGVKIFPFLTEEINRTAEDFEKFMRLIDSFVSKWKALEELTDNARRRLQEGPSLSPQQMFPGPGGGGVRPPMGWRSGADGGGGGGSADVSGTASPGGGIGGAAPTEAGTSLSQASGGLNRAAYDDMFKGTPLAGQYDRVVEAAQRNNVPPATMAAIMAHETGQGKSAMLNQRLNPAGLMDPKTNWKTGQTFGSIGEGIDAAGKTIGKNYARAGGSLEAMQGTYAPIGAANDPGGLNKSWTAGVTRYQKQLTDGGGAATGDNSSGRIPPDVMNQARQLVQRGGKSAEVQAYMQSRGYYRGGAWCGQFAASVVSQSGGRPPPGFAIASNWRNWGQPVSPDQIQEGDIAVRKGVRTGSTGSHVTLVGKVNPQTGRFEAVGGNQRSGITMHQMGMYDFRRGVPTRRLDAANDRQAAPMPKSSVTTNVYSNGTSARAETTTDGPQFADTTVKQTRQMVPTDASQMMGAP